jgi:hypothetical protein
MFCLYLSLPCRAMPGCAVAIAVTELRGCSEPKRSISGEAGWMRAYRLEWEERCCIVRFHAYGEMCFYS